MQSLAALTTEMRALGIKSLALELDGPVTSIYEAPEDRPTEAPLPLRPEKGPGTCQWEGCGDANGGMFGGVSPEYCERHALASAGVR